jgi:hypothetical protein
MTFKQFPFFLISFSVILGLTLPVLVQDGMFMDGMLYTCVSKNLANGIGSFWFPVFSEFGFWGLTTFHEHPPLVFAIQSVFFSSLGDGMYTERIYVFFTIIINSSLIILIWQLINHDSKEGEIAWLPLILWISIPVCFWSFSNNMHENTMGIFVLLSVLFYLKAVNANSTIFLIFSGLFIFLATFSKGIPGFFPIVLPIIYWASIQQIKLKTVIFQTFLLIAIPVSIYALLICFPEARLSLSNYLIKRVLHRIEDNPTVDSQFYILGRLFLELLIPVSITLIIYFVFRRKLFFDKAKISFAVFFILVGFSGALPLLLTKVQKGFYFVPSLPFFAIGFALLISNPVREWSVKQLNSVNKKWIHLISIICFISVMILSIANVGKCSRDTELLNDVAEFGEVIPPFTSVSISDNRWNDWPLQCYLIRYHDINISPKNNQNKFRIVDKNLIDSTLIGYKKLNLNTLKFDLYSKN